MLYMVTVTINIPPMLAYIPYMDPVEMTHRHFFNLNFVVFVVGLLIAVFKLSCGFRSPDYGLVMDPKRRVLYPF